MIDPTDGTGRLKTLKVGQLNQALDKLVEAAGNFNEQANILRGLMQVRTPRCGASSLLACSRLLWCTRLASRCAGHLTRPNGLDCPNYPQESQG